VIRRAAVPVLLVAIAFPAMGRCQTATLYGTVRDSATGAPLEAVRITLPGVRTVAMTNAAGRYRFEGVPAGQVLVSVQRFGYTPRADSVQVPVRDSLRVDFVLAANAYYLAPVIVTAGKRSQLVDRVVASVVVIPDSEIARRAVTTIDEAVDKAPGVQFLGGQINIRGSSGFEQGLGSRVLLLVDGVPANQGDRGGIDWDLIPVDQVQRVEIVKGAGSSLYGSAALGGIVNLITPDIPDGAHGRIRAVGGTFAPPPHSIWEFRDARGALERLDVSGSYGGDALRAAIAAGGWHSDGYRQQDSSDTWELSGRGDWYPSQSNRLHFLASWVSHQYEDPLRWCEFGRCPGDSGLAYQPFLIDTAVAGAFTRSDKGLFAATFEHRPSETASSWLARGSWLRTDFTDIRRPTGEYGVSNREGLELRGELESASNPGRVVTVGTELTRSDVTSDAFGIHAEGAYAAYAEGEQPLGAAPVRVTAGARVDLLNVDGGDISAVVSPRIGAVVPKGRLVWRASAGRGFRAPSLAERFVQTSLAGITVIPNPDLVPESAWSFELGNFAQVASRLTTDVALFWTEASNLIEPSVANGAEIQFRNVTRARLAGVDAALAFFPFTQRLGLKLAYTLLYAEQLAHDTVPEQPLAFRPRHLVTAAADYRLGRFTAGGDFRFMSRYERVELYPPSDPILAPKVLDLRARYDMGMLSVLLRAQNVLNYIYNLVPQQLAPVRAVSVTATVSY